MSAKYWIAVAITLLPVARISGQTLDPNLLNSIAHGPAQPTFQTPQDIQAQKQKLQEQQLQIREQELRIEQEREKLQAQIEQNREKAYGPQRPPEAPESTMLAGKLTFGLCNGRFWATLGEVPKGFFLAGYLDASHYAGEKTVTAPGVTNLDILKGVDRFFEEPENLAVPIASAIQIFGAKTRGESAEDIERMTSAIRSIALSAASTNTAVTK